MTRVRRAGAALSGDDASMRVQFCACRGVLDEFEGLKAVRQFSSVFQNSIRSLITPYNPVCVPAIVSLCTSISLPLNISLRLLVSVYVRLFLSRSLAA